MELIIITNLSWEKRGRKNPELGMQEPSLFAGLGEYFATKNPRSQVTPFTFIEKPNITSDSVHIYFR